MAMCMICMRLVHTDLLQRAPEKAQHLIALARAAWQEEGGLIDGMLRSQEWWEYARL